VGRCAVPFSGTAAIGLINLIYNLGRYEQIVRLKLLLSEPEATNRRLKSEDQNQKRPKTNQQRKIKHQENTNGRSRDETSYTENRTATINPTPKSSFWRFP
jgi:hypothetical protein